MYSTLEELLLKGCMGECYDKVMTFNSEHYSADIHVANLKVQLRTLVSTNVDSDDVTLGNVIKYLQGLSTMPLLSAIICLP